MKLKKRNVSAIKKMPLRGVRRLRPRIKGASPVTTGASDPSPKRHFFYCALLILYSISLMTFMKYMKDSYGEA